MAHVGRASQLGLNVSGRVAMLASVMNVSEARACVRAGVDIVDCKDPTRGALGALSGLEIQKIAAEVGGVVPVSATVGDLPCRVEPVVGAVIETAKLGVDFVKVGLFLDGAENGDGFNGALPVIEALGGLDLGGAGLVAVLLADDSFEPGVIEPLAAAGFEGVMVDTADKSSGSLLEVLGLRELSQFVASARNHGLFCGLAGRLLLEHIPQVVGYGPDIVGFRGALCARGVRGAGLDDAALAAVRGALVEAGEPGSNDHSNSTIAAVSC